jgi:transcriptional regulator with XRE-family HTH domain
MSLDFDLRQARHTQGLTQLDLSRLSGVSVRQLKALESGSTQDPHPDTTRRLQSALGLAEPALQSLAQSLRARAHLFRQVSLELRTTLPQVGYLEMEASLEPDLTTLYFITAIHDASGKQIFDDATCEAADEIMDLHGSLHLPRLDAPGAALWLDVGQAAILTKEAFLARTSNAPSPQAA